MSNLQKRIVEGPRDMATAETIRLMGIDYPGAEDFNHTEDRDGAEVVEITGKADAILEVLPLSEWEDRFFVDWTGGSVELPGVPVGNGIPCPRCGRRFVTHSTLMVMHSIEEPGCHAFLTLAPGNAAWVLLTLARGMEAAGEAIHENFLWWRGQKATLEVTIRVPKDYQDIAESGQMVQDHPHEGLVCGWDEVFGDGYAVDLKLVNAKTEEGGPWCEAVWYEHDCEVGVSEPTGSLVGRWEGPDGHVLIVELEQPEPKGTP